MRLRACASFMRLFFAGFKVYGMFLDLFNNSFLLDFSFKPLQCNFNGFAFFYNTKCLSKSPPRILVHDLFPISPFMSS